MSFFFFILSESGSVLQKFLDETADMSSDERAKHLEKNMVRKTCCYTFLKKKNHFGEKQYIKFLILYKYINSYADILQLAMP